MSLIEAILGYCGITILISAGTIFEDIRTAIKSKSDFLGELISCPMCLGFWVGMFFGFVSMKFPPIVLGGIVSVSSWILYNLGDVLNSGSAYMMHLISKDQFIQDESSQADTDL